MKDLTCLFVYSLSRMDSAHEMQVEILRGAANSIKTLTGVYCPRSQRGGLFVKPVYSFTNSTAYLAFLFTSCQAFHY